MPDLSLKPMPLAERYPDPPGFACSCPVAGWCATFGREQTEASRAVCNGSRLTPPQQAAYRAIWRKKADEAGPEKAEAARAAAAHRQLMINERLAGPEVWPCVHRGEVIRQELCEMCGSSGRKEAVFSCAIHQECSLRAYKTHGQDAKICSRCKDRKEEPAMDTPEKSERAEQPGPETQCSDRIIELHPPAYPVDPLQVYDRWGRLTDSIRDIWRGCAGFLVCGGPSLKTLPVERLKERGIVSLGINNASGFAPVRAATWSDPTEKFHHGISLDPAIMKLVPQARLTDAVAVKMPDGKFAWTDMQLGDCPNVWGFNRSCEWRPEQFLTSEAATWGNNDAGVAATGRPKIIFTFFLGLRLLHYLGCRRIYLLGADFAMQPVTEAGGGYAFNEARDAGAAKCNNDHYKRANVMLKELRPVLDKAGFEIFNCLGKNTQFITRDGVRSFGDFSDGERTTVLTHAGRWMPATVRCGGVQKVSTLTFKKSGGGTNQEVVATNSHRWLKRDGDFTDAIQEGEHLAHAPLPFAAWDYGDAEPLQKLAWCYGYVFGDGTTVSAKYQSYSMVRLCKRDSRWQCRFEEMGFKTSQPLSCGGDFFAYTGSYQKTLPEISDDIELLRAFVRGWLDADGGKANEKDNFFKNIQITGGDKIDWARRVFPLVGVYITCEAEVTAPTNYGPRGDKTVRFGLSVGAGNSNLNSFYRLASKVPSGEQEVWCLEVDEDKSFVLPTGIVTGNCNRQTALEAFPYSPFEQALADCRGNIPEEPFDLNGWYAKTLTKSGRSGRKAAKRAADTKRAVPNPHGKAGQKIVKAGDPASRQQEAEREIAARKAAAKPQTRAERKAARKARIEARAARIAARAAVLATAAGDQNLQPAGLAGQ